MSRQPLATHLSSIALLEHAESLLQARRVEEALQAFYRAEEQGASADECAAGRWDCHMLLGEYEEAWRESDQIEQRGRPDPNRFWDGRSLEGRSVIVRCLHGLGDTLQFIRFLPHIRVQVNCLTLEAQPQLVSLLKESFAIRSLGVDRLMTWGEPEPKWDAQIEINELPRILRMNQDDLSGNVPYLAVNEHTKDKRRGEMLHVGLVWAAGDFNVTRSVPVGLIDELFDLTRVRFYSLQGGARQNEASRWNGQLTPLTHAHTTIQDLAHFMKGLDLIITVDTMAAHLAGALGCPTWILLLYASDWRWMLNRTNTPWYPSARLFRQPRAGDWASVLKLVKQELSALTRTRKPGAR